MWAWSVQVTCGTCVSGTAWLQEGRADALTKALCVAFLCCRLVVVVSVAYFLLCSQMQLVQWSVINVCSNVAATWQ